jgi:hypothetical protein
VKSYGHGAQVTVHRTDGRVEDNWWVFRNGQQGNPFAAPEICLVEVVQPENDMTFAEAEEEFLRLGRHSTVTVRMKRVNLLTLMEWNGDA